MEGSAGTASGHWQLDGGDPLDHRLALVEHGPVTKLEHSWCERNKEPILETFRDVLPKSGTLLEVGSGSGQHAFFFSEELPHLLWLPSDIDDENLESICDAARRLVMEEIFEMPANNFILAFRKE